MRLSFRRNRRVESQNANRPRKHRRSGAETREFIRPKLLRSGDQKAGGPATHIVLTNSWQSTATTWVHIFTMLILVGSLFLTVYPAYQKEVLEEKAARLTLEKDELELLAAMARQEKVAIEEEVADAKAQLERIENTARAATAETVELEARIASANRRLADLVADYESLSEASQELAWIIFTRALQVQVIQMFPTSSLEERMRGTDSTRTSISERFRHDLVNHQFDSLALVREALTGARDLPEIDFLDDVTDVDVFVDRAQHLVDRHADFLGCPTLNEDEWMVALNEVLAERSNIVESCVEDSWATLIQSQGWSDWRTDRIRRGHFETRQSELYRNYCSWQFDFQVEQDFYYEFSKYEVDCRARLTTIENILAGRDAGITVLGKVGPPGKIPEVEPMTVP